MKKRSRLPWILAVAAVAAIGALLVFTRSSGAANHPHPRPGITGARVLRPSTFAGYERISRAYQMARVVPETLDGIFCYCRCSEHLGHRSLLSCFEDEHAASCDICLAQAETAYSMRQQGSSLDQIRQAVDRQFLR